MTLYKIFITIFLSKAAAQVCFQSPFERNEYQFNESFGGYTRSIVGKGALVIATSYQFECCGNITQWEAILQFLSGHENDITFQVWRPSPTTQTSGCYSLVGERQFAPDSSAGQMSTVTVTQAVNLAFQPRDVVGLYVGRRIDLIMLKDPPTETVWYITDDDEAESADIAGCTTQSTWSSRIAAPLISIQIETTPCHSMSLQTSQTNILLTPLPTTATATRETPRPTSIASRSTPKDPISSILLTPSPTTTTHQSKSNESLYTQQTKIKILSTRTKIATLKNELGPATAHSKHTPSATSDLPTSPGSVDSSSNASRTIGVAIAMVIVILSLLVVIALVAVCIIVIRKKQAKKTIKLNLKIPNSRKSTKIDSNPSYVTSKSDITVSTKSEPSYASIHIKSRHVNSPEDCLSRNRQSTCITQNNAYIPTITTSIDDNDGDPEYDYVRRWTKQEKKKGKETAQDAERKFSLSASYVIPNLKADNVYY